MRETTYRNWSENELKEMLKLVSTTLQPATPLTAADWSRIAGQLGTGRPYNAVRSRYERYKRTIEERKKETQVAAAT